MGIRDRNIVDWCVKRKNGDVVLIIVDEMSWDEPGEHVLALQDKLKRYLDFIESGEMYSLRLEDGAFIQKSSSVLVEIIGQFAMPPIGEELVKRAWASFRTLNVGLSFKFNPAPPTMPQA